MIRRVALFCHSLASDWNHGNAHFLRGIARALVRRGVAVEAWEPADGWSAQNLVADAGPGALEAWRTVYPELSSRRYRLDQLDLDEALDGVDLVIAHEWSAPALIRRLGRHRAAGGRYRLYFHDTHHRMASDPAAMAVYELDGFDGVLAFGAIIAELYRRRGWGGEAVTWHEAADVSLFRPLREVAPHHDLVWVGNWGDDERTTELQRFLIDPVRELGLSARVHGVRYPDAARRTLAEAGIEYAGYLPNTAVPAAFAAARMTVHVPRRPYARMLPGIPTIRMFEAMACGIPLISAPWDDVEGLFSPGSDYLVASDGAAMARHMALLRDDPSAAGALGRRARATIAARHTCDHRVEQLLALCGAPGRARDALQEA